MPPKKRSSTKSKSLKSTSQTFNSVSIQTERDYEAEIIQYQTQIQLLQTELADYKEKLALLENENTTLKNHNNNLKYVVSSNDTKVPLIEINSKIINNKVSSPSITNKSAKGCSCKGNCSNRVCGCVKKGVACNDHCKCNEEQCKNQDIEKENYEQGELSTEGQKTLEKLGRLTLNQETLHASEKKARKSIFSPLIDRSKLSNADKPYTASPLAFETRRRLFHQESDDLIDVDGDGDHLSVPLENNASDKIQENVQNKETLHLPQINETKSKSVSPNRHITQRKKANIPLKSDKSEKKKENEEKASHASQSDKTEPKRLSANESCVTQRKKVNVNGLLKIENVYNIDKSNNEKNDTDDQIVLGKVQHSPVIPKTGNNNQLKVESLAPIIQSNINVRSSLSSTESNSNDNNLNISYNPMMPKHQLPRSPIQALGTVIIPENKRFSPPREDLAVPEIDWEQHQSELVMCEICKRKFFPHRIAKHIISCKGI